MEQKLFIETPSFTGRNVPIDEISKVTGKSPLCILDTLLKTKKHHHFPTSVLIN